MNIRKIAGLFVALLALTIWTSCNKDEQTVSTPEPDNEFITTVKIIAINANNPTDADTAVWKDLEPEKNTPPDTSMAILNLSANATYNVQVQFWDDTKTPSENLTTEIKERGNYHLICFSPSSGLNLDIMRTDKDTNKPPLPIGLNDKFVTGTSGFGHLNIKLRHQPNVKDGTCAPGSTDANVNYRININ